MKGTHVEMFKYMTERENREGEKREMCNQKTFVISPSLSFCYQDLSCAMGIFYLRNTGLMGECEAATRDENGFISQCKCLAANFEILQLPACI